VGVIADWKPLSYGMRSEQCIVLFPSLLTLGRKAATRSHFDQKEAIALLPVLWKHTLLRSSIT